MRHESEVLFTVVQHLVASARWRAWLFGPRGELVVHSRYVDGPEDLPGDGLWARDADPGLESVCTLTFKVRRRGYRLVIDPSSEAAIRGRVSLVAARWRLSRAERDVLHFLARGLCNKDLARAIFRDLETVKKHVRRILFKSRKARRELLVAQLWMPSLDEELLQREAHRRFRACRRRQRPRGDPFKNGSFEP
jgi:DNA-binding CsgD family transcriptional regulator